MKNEFTCDGMTRGTTAGTTVWIRQTGTNECMMDEIQGHGATSVHRAFSYGYRDECMT